jgi:hypothetical protein
MRNVSMSARAQEVAAAERAAERGARAEDRRIVFAAVNDGRIPEHRVDFYIEAMLKDREGVRGILAVLAQPSTPPRKRVVDARAGSALQRATGVVATDTTPQDEIVDSLGLPIPGVPAPVRIQRGKPREQWTKQEVDDAALWALGPKFRNGLKPPPGSDTVYQPSPNDPYEFVQTGNGQGEFRAKDQYLGRIDGNG